MPTLYRVIVPVSDIEKAQNFYSAVFQQAGKRVSPGRHYYDLNGIIMALYDPVSDGDRLNDGWKHHENQYIYISVENLEAAYERAKVAGAQFITDKIEKMPWGERLVYMRDPSGNPICFVDKETVFLGDEA